MQLHRDEWWFKKKLPVTALDRLVRVKLCCRWLSQNPFVESREHRQWVCSLFFCSFWIDLMTVLGVFSKSLAYTCVNNSPLKYLCLLVWNTLKFDTSKGERPRLTISRSLARATTPHLRVLVTRPLTSFCSQTLWVTLHIVLSKQWAPHFTWSDEAEWRRVRGAWVMPVLCLLLPASWVPGPWKPLWLCQPYPPMRFLPHLWHSVWLCWFDWRNNPGSKSKIY